MTVEIVPYRSRKGDDEVFALSQSGVLGRWRGQWRMLYGGVLWYEVWPIATFPTIALAEIATLDMERFEW